MRAAYVLLAVVVTALATLVVGPTAAPAATSHYYVALGDSLAKGYMPGVGDTDQGYVDDLYATLHAADPSLQLVKLGCSGETTTTMINGGKCSYGAGSQLAAAEQFLTAHREDVRYLTLDIGANDVDGCASGASIDTACLLKGVATITTNLNTILSRVKAADGGRPRSVGMTYYDPFLEYWLHGVQGQAVATASVGLLTGINTAESAEYLAYGFRIADVFTAFQTLNFLPLGYVPGHGIEPVNVATICRLTFECDQQNIHANVAGYQLIAQTFAARMA
jgi:lysophospholipase L1-like esterase